MFFKTLKNILFENKLFFLGFSDWIILGIVLQVWLSQFELSILINGFHNLYRDFFFKYLTFAGDGLFALALLIPVFVWKRKYLLCAALCFYIPSLVVQFFKHFVFSEMSRPAMIMEKFPQLHFVEGEFMNVNNSFPSGHATSAFAIAAFLSFVIKNKKWQPLFVILATLVAVSRVYLLQHFFRDVFAGSIIGVVFVTIIFGTFRWFYERKDITDF